MPSVCSDTLASFIDGRLFPCVVRRCVMCRCVGCPGTGAGSEHSLAWTRQSLLQQFKAVEGCVASIEEFERQHGFTYDWVLRTRTDTYWMGPPPPLSVLDKQVGGGGGGGERGW